MLGPAFFKIDLDGFPEWANVNNSCVLSQINELC